MSLSSAWDSARSFFVGTGAERAVRETLGAMDNAINGDAQGLTALKNAVESVAIGTFAAAVVDGIAAAIFAGKFLATGAVAPLFFTVVFSFGAYDCFQVAATLLDISKNHPSGYFDLNRGELQLSVKLPVIIDKLFENTILCKKAVSLCRDFANSDLFKNLTKE
jgi:hypothetical protein